jgi:hypothetical protein
MILGLLVACSGQSGGFNSPDGGAGTPVGEGGVAVLADTGISPGTTYDVYVAPTADTGTVITGGDGSTGGGQCMPNCTSDQDCQSTCPAVAGALNCCDTTSGVCFTSSESACPDTSGSGEGGTAPVEGGTY